MRSAKVQSVDWLGELPDQDAGAEPVLRIETNLPAGEQNAFYMDVVDPRPQAGDPISFDIAAGLLGTHHEVEWDGRRIRQRGYSFDWTPPLVEIPTTKFALVRAPDTSLLGKLGLK